MRGMSDAFEGWGGKGMIVKALVALRRCCYGQEMREEERER